MLVLYSSYKNSAQKLRMSATIVLAGFVGEEVFQECKVEAGGYPRRSVSNYCV